MTSRPWLALFLEVVLLVYSVSGLLLIYFNVYLTLHTQLFLIRVNYPENKDDCMGCLSHVKHGAALSGLCYDNYCYLILAFCFMHFLFTNTSNSKFFQWFGGMSRRRLLMLLKKISLLSRTSFVNTRSKGGMQ
jgi:hypothetical protein